MPGRNHPSDQLPSHQATFYSDTKAPLFIPLQPQSLDLICCLNLFVLLCCLPLLILWANVFSCVGEVDVKGERVREVVHIEGGARVPK